MIKSKIEEISRKIATQLHAAGMLEKEAKNAKKTKKKTLKIQISRILHECNNDRRGLCPISPANHPVNNWANSAGPQTNRSTGPRNRPPHSESILKKTKSEKIHPNLWFKRFLKLFHWNKISKYSISFCNLFIWSFSIFFCAAHSNDLKLIHTRIFFLF